MDGLLWPAWADIALGGLGTGFALWSIARRRQGRPMHPDAAKADLGLLLISLLMVALGIARMAGL